MIDQSIRIESALLTQEQLAHLGDGAIAYVKPLRITSIAMTYPRLLPSSL